MTPVPATIEEGETTTLRVRATAIGHSARDAFVSLAPANGLTYQAVGGGGSCELINGFIGCRLGTIAAGTTVQRNVTALGTAAGTRVATAKATTSDTDASQANNTGTATVIVTAAPKVTQTFSTGNIAVPIPDLGMVEVPLGVGPSTTIFDLNAAVRLNHSFDGDLAISLVAPGGGTVVDLSSNNGAGGDNYGSGPNNCSGTHTRFDDQAATPITAGAVPFAGAFKPEASLNAMNGLPSGGTWRLRVADQAGADTGAVGCFRLTIKRAAP
ncbi:MAG: hypothetical protein GEU88_07635 [Solirubrobacterales bacterium]|nr:hypothetical protein [Solirubrobacterales bacterium]